MNEKIREAFDNIRADETMKKNTKKYLLRIANEKKTQKRTVFSFPHLAVAAAVCMLLLIGWRGYALYFTTAYIISVDVNPSIELNVNRFDKVVFLEAFNSDGERILSEENYRFQNYRNVLEKLLESDAMAEYLTQDSYVSVMVCGDSEKKNEEVLADLHGCTTSYENVHCSSGNVIEADDAHSAGMTCGKYKAYLSLKALDPEITPEEVQALSMKQIWKRISELGGTVDEWQGSETEHEEEQNDLHHGHSHN